MRKLGLIICIILTAIMVAGCTTTAMVTGTVTYSEQVELPEEGVAVIIKVEEISRADAPAVTIGEQIIENPGNQVSIPFKIKYDPSEIDERFNYAMRVRIEVNGELWFINTSRFDVITYNNPTSDVKVVVDKQGSIR